LSLFLLIGTISIGLGSAGLVMLAFRLVGRRAPRWTLPAVAGVVMLTFHVWMEYAWFARISNQLSARITIVETVTRSAWWQPWSLIEPQIVRFTAIDGASVEAVGDELAQVELWLVDRYSGSRRVTQIYDCAAPRRLDVADTTGLDADALRRTDAWRSIAPGDPHRLAACRLADRPVDRGDGGRALG